MTVGEAVGFAIPAATGGLLALAGSPALVVYPSMILAGACEGALLGVGNPTALPLVAIFGSLLLLSLPSAQWVVLRCSGYRAASWIPVNAGAWTAGILWTLGPSPFIDENTPAAVLFGVYPLAGLVMAATVAALTGIAAHRLVLAAGPNLSAVNGNGNGNGNGSCLPGGNRI